MSIFNSKARRLVSATFLIAFAIAVVGQNPPADTEVIRISTELVQTGVVVLDKQGRFVEGLKPEQFLLKVDGKIVTPAFFEHVVAGTANEERLEAAGARGNSANVPVVGGSSYRGRTIIFFIDDLHLSAESVQRTRKALLEFVDNQMAPEDQVAIASPSGQIGFLQRFTDLQAVVRAAVARLTHRPYTIRDAENITMTEYLALKIDQGDKDAISHFAEEILKSTNFRNPGGNLGPPSGPYGGKPDASNSQTSGMSRAMAERNVKERANVLLKQSAGVTINTLTTLESLMRSSSQMSGRKLVFFVSDGFFLNDRNTAFGDKLKQITDAAIRAGVVIYTMDARGIVSMTDASSNVADPQGRLSRAGIGEIAASQDALTALADDTGGRTVLNGALTTAVNNALQETSNYYLLAWKPPAEEQKGGNFKRIEVSINGRPELTVRLPRGFLMTEPRTATKDKEPASSEPAITSTAPAKGPEAALMSALGAPSARKGLPTTLAVSFVDVPDAGPVLTAATQMATDILGYGTDGKQPASIDIAGIVLNDQGKQAAGFKTRLKVDPSARAAAAAERAGVIYSHKLPLKPGIYQVRVAAVDAQSGRVGSAAQWIEIPDLAGKQLTMSSLLVGGQFIGSGQKTGPTSNEGQMQFSVDRRFARGAHLNFLTIIYNASRPATGAAELDAQIKISRGGQSIVTSPLRKVVVEAGADAARIPYGADIALQTLPAGRYLLQVTVTDRVAKTSASQLVSFAIE